MPMATAETINFDLERLDTSIETLERFSGLLEDCARLAGAVAFLRQQLHEAFRAGLERAGLPRLLASVRRVTERHSAFCRKALAVFEGGEDAATVEAYLREADDFLAWVRALESHAADPLPFDESLLPPAPEGPTAEGYISAGEARTRLQARRKP